MSDTLRPKRQKKKCHFPSIFQRLPKFNIVVSSIILIGTLVTAREGGLYFILSYNDNYDFDAKVGHWICGFCKGCN